MLSLNLTGLDNFMKYQNDRIEAGFARGCAAVCEASQANGTQQLPNCSVMYVIHFDAKLFDSKDYYYLISVQFVRRHSVHSG